MLFRSQGAVKALVRFLQLLQPFLIGLADAGGIRCTGLPTLQPDGLLVLQFAAIAHRQEAGQDIECRHHLHVGIVQRPRIADTFSSAARSGRSQSKLAAAAGEGMATIAVMLEANIRLRRP